MANLFPSFNLARMRPACSVKMAKFRSIPNHKIQAAQSIFLIFFCDIAISPKIFKEIFDQTCTAFISVSPNFTTSRCWSSCQHDGIIRVTLQTVVASSKRKCFLDIQSIYIWTYFWHSFSALIAVKVNLSNSTIPKYLNKEHGLWTAICKMI